MLIAQLEDSVIHMRDLPPNLNSAQCNEGKIAHAKDPTLSGWKDTVFIGSRPPQIPSGTCQNGVVGRLTDFHEQLIRLKRSIYIQRLGRTFSN